MVTMNYLWVLNSERRRRREKGRVWGCVCVCVCVCVCLLQLIYLLTLKLFAHRYFDLGFPWWFSGEEWQPTPVLLPGKSHGQRSLVGYSPWGHQESDITKQLLFLSFSGKESACHFRSHQFDPWVRKIPWRKKWQPTPVFLPGKFHGQKSLEGYSPWGHKTARHDLATKQQFWPKPSAFRSHFGRKTVCYSLASSLIAPWTARRSDQSILKEISP